MNKVFKVKKAAFFALRQVYRLLVIFPYTLIFSLLWNFRKKTATGEGTCFIVTSLIYCKQKKLTYSDTRSVYNAEERYRQTLQTIASIRSKVPNAVIVCVEAGLEANPFNIKQSVDSYLYIGAKWWVRLACDSRFKSLGETVMLLTAKKYFPKANRYFKISGRYFLNETFRLADWEKGDIMYHYIRPDFISTRLYSYTSAACNIWEKALWKGLPHLFLDYPVEHILARFTPKKKVTTIDVVGISGADATSGKGVKE